MSEIPEFAKAIGWMVKELPCVGIITLLLIYVAVRRASREQP